MFNRQPVNGHCRFSAGATSPHRHLNDKSLTVGADVSLSHERIRNPEESTRCSCLKDGVDVTSTAMTSRSRVRKYISFPSCRHRMPSAPRLQVCDLDSGPRRSSRLVGIKWPHVNLHRADIGFVRRVRQKASVG